jgi:restriction endonuclease S subunit
MSADEWVSGTWGDLVAFRKQERTTEGRLLTVATKGTGTRLAAARPESRTPTHLIKTGELVYLRQGAAAGVIAVSDHEGLVSVNFPVGAISDRANHDFIRLLLRAPEVQAMFRSASVGTAQPFLSERDFANVPVRYPGSSDVQRRIVDLLSAADQMVEAETAEYRAAQDLRRQLLVDLMRSFAEAPDSKTVKLGDVASTQLGKMLNTASQTGAGARPYLRAANIPDWGMVDTSDLRSMDFSDDELEKFSVQPGDLLVTEGGAAGRCAVYRGSEMVCFQNAIHRVRADSKATSNEFIALVLEHLSLTGQLDRYCSTTTIKHLSSSSLKSVEFQLPVLDAQSRLIPAVAACTASVDTLRTRCDKASQLRDQLLHDLLSGTHTIPESYDRFLVETSA